MPAKVLLVFLKQYIVAKSLVIRWTQIIRLYDWLFRALLSISQYLLSKNLKQSEAYQTKHSIKLLFTDLSPTIFACSLRLGSAILELSNQSNSKRCLFTDLSLVQPICYLRLNSTSTVKFFDQSCSKRCLFSDLTPIIFVFYLTLNSTTIEQSDQSSSEY